MPDGAADTHPALAVHNLTVHYGRVPILHDLTLTLERGVVAVVGRNGMGKSTLCKTIVGLVPATSGGIWAGRTELSGLPPHRIAQAGVGYVPQGRRVWASLSVDEHLRLAFRGPRSAYWTPERIYDTFPRLYERRSAGGSELSGGEQQMLAIGRALAGNPRLLVMDEPTEGLAPVIVAQVTAMIKALATDGGMSVLLVEQNLGVAVEVSERIAIMMHGRLARELKARELAADQDLQRRLLGVGRQGEEEDESLLPEDRAAEVQVIRIARQHGEEAGTPSYTFGDGARPVYSAAAVPTRWSSDGGGPPEAALAPDADPVLADPADEHRTGPELPPVSIAAMTGRHAYVLGTFDTKREELMFLAHRLRHLGIKTVTVDLATGGRPSPADVSPREVARHHPKGAGAVFTGDRGTSIAAMA
ncbi:MAG: ATP-binding cassette domain-containing protein, partial [Hyphomicrobiaceae bacterium]